MKDHRKKLNKRNFQKLKIIFGAKKRCFLKLNKPFY